MRQGTLPEMRRPTDIMRLHRYGGGRMNPGSLKKTPIEAMIDDYYRFIVTPWIGYTDSPWEDIRIFGAYLSQVDEEMYPIGDPE
jgi:hypothetical protein